MFSATRFGCPQFSSYGLPLRDTQHVVGYPAVLGILCVGYENNERSSLPEDITIASRPKYESGLNRARFRASLGFHIQFSKNNHALLIEPAETREKNTRLHY